MATSVLLVATQWGITRLIVLWECAILGEIISLRRGKTRQVEHPAAANEKAEVCGCDAHFIVSSPVPNFPVSDQGVLELASNTQDIRSGHRHTW